MYSERISRDELFMKIAELIGRRSTCPRGGVGAVLVRDYRIITTGYVGAPSGLEHCYDLGCHIIDEGCIRTVHAEANAIAFASKHGIKTLGSTLYCTHSPCLDCAKLIANAGVERVVYREEYRDSSGKHLLDRADVRVLRYTGD